MKSTSLCLLLTTAFTMSACSPSAPKSEDLSDGIDCRNDQIGCNEGFSCTLNVQNTWECLPDGGDASTSDAATLSDASVPDARTLDAAPTQDADITSADASIADAEISERDSGATALAVGEQNGTPGNIVRDIAYGDTDERQVLDLYLLEGQTMSPLLIWIHGGGWRGGSHSMVNAFFLNFRRRGYVIASIEYRLSDHPWPATIQDVKSAIRFLRQNAAEYGIDPNRFVAAGSSAGGHLVSMLGTSANHPEFIDASHALSEVSDEVQAVVNFYGPTQLQAMDADAEQAGCPSDALCHSCADSPESMLLDCQPNDCLDRANLASPVFHVDGSEPPFLTLHGLEDCTVPTPQGTRLHTALRQAGSDSTLIEVPNAGHSLPACLAGGNSRRIIDFVEANLRQCADEMIVRPDDSMISQCHWDHCPVEARQCNENPICVSLEVCFQECFANALGNCIRRCLDQVPSSDDGRAPHEALFTCARPHGCYPRPTD